MAAALSPWRGEVPERGDFRAAARYTTQGGAEIFVLPLEIFPGHITHAYWVERGDYALLWDLGSADSWPQLQARLAEIEARFGWRRRPPDLAVCSHAHSDHSGAAAQIAAWGVPLAAHPAEHEAILHATSGRPAWEARLRAFCARAGAPEAASHLASLRLPSPDTEISLPLWGGERLGPGWEVLHVPGHSPGQLLLGVDEVLLTSDHLLAEITPLQQPAWHRPGCGLAAYLGALDRITDAWSLGLSAHRGPIRDLVARREATRAHHLRRLAKTRAALHTPATIAEIAAALFGRPPGSAGVLALLESAAHLEHLAETGCAAAAQSAPDSPLVYSKILEIECAHLPD